MSVYKYLTVVPLSVLALLLYWLLLCFSFGCCYIGYCSVALSVVDLFNVALLNVAQLMLLWSIGCCSIGVALLVIALLAVSLLQPLSLPQPSHREKLAHFLEQRSKEGLIDSETVAQHQRMNRNMMSQKMMEMTRLQNSLTDQAKVCTANTQPAYYIATS